MLFVDTYSALIVSGTGTSPDLLALKKEAGTDSPHLRGIGPMVADF
jgi:hypothetical protein